MTNPDSTPGSRKSRPLSPHLQIYSPQMTSALSILHRASGIVLTIGLFVLAWWLLAAAAGPEAYATFRAAAAHPVGVFVGLGLSYAAFFHLCTGIRHLIWDSGMFVTIPGIYRTGYTAIAVSVVLTVVFWLLLLKGA